MAYLLVTNCAKRLVLVCLVTMLVFLLRLYGDSLGWDLLVISAYKGLPGKIFEINLIYMHFPCALVRKADQSDAMPDYMTEKAL